jgi:hypothetical protein
LLSRKRTKPGPLTNANLRPRHGVIEAIGRLRAALVAGKIPVTEEKLATPHAGLNTIGHGYRIEKVIKNAKTDAELKKELSRLYAACRTVLMS